MGAKQGAQRGRMMAGFEEGAPYFQAPGTMLGGQQMHQQPYMASMPVQWPTMAAGSTMPTLQPVSLMPMPSYQYQMPQAQQQPVQQVDWSHYQTAPPIQLPPLQLMPLQAAPVAPQPQQVNLPSMPAQQQPSTQLITSYTPYPGPGVTPQPQAHSRLEHQSTLSQPFAQSTTHMPASYASTSYTPNAWPGQRQMIPKYKLQNCQPMPLSNFNKQ